MLEHPLQKSYYQFLGNVRVYLHAKNQLPDSLPSLNIAKIGKLVILGNMGILSHTHQKW